MQVHSLSGHFSTSPWSLRFFIVSSKSAPTTPEGGSGHWFFWQRQKDITQPAWLLHKPGCLGGSPVCSCREKCWPCCARPGVSWQASSSICFVKESVQKIAHNTCLTVSVLCVRLESLLCPCSFHIECTKRPNSCDGFLFVWSSRMRWVAMWWPAVNQCGPVSWVYSHIMLNHRKCDHFWSRRMTTSYV